jgi:hypothetical protein
MIYTASENDENNYKNVIADEHNSEECYCLQYRSVLVGWSVDFTEKPAV